MDEKLYLVCRECGEAFDSIEAAFTHMCELGDATYAILPESEAM